MSYEDKLITKLEEQNEEIMLLEGLILAIKKEMKRTEIENIKLRAELNETIINIKLRVKDNIPFNEKELHPNLKFILTDLLEHPNTIRFGFFMKYCNADNLSEVVEAFKILVSCKSEEETIGNNPIFKKFIEVYKNNY